MYLCLQNVIDLKNKKTTFQINVSAKYIYSFRNVFITSQRNVKTKSLSWCLPEFV